MRMLYRILLPLLVLCLAHPAAAQDLNPRIGLGVESQLTVASNAKIGPGFRTRISAPVNSDLSIAGDIGVATFILEGRDEASYAFTPQASLIVTLPAQGMKAPYLLFGVGAYLPFSSGEGIAEGPVLHAGYGRVHVLNETTLFYEVDPGLIIGAESVALSLPLRVGVIF